MKRLLLLFLCIVICPLSAVIVNGYKYKIKNSIVYFLSDAHNEERFEDKNIFMPQCNALKTIFLSLIKDFKCSFFVERDSQENNNHLFACMHNFFKSNKKLSFMDESGLKEEFINTNTLVLWNTAWSLAKDQLAINKHTLTDKAIFKEISKDIKINFLFLDFIQECEKLKITLNENILSSSFEDLIFNSSFINDLNSSYSSYRERRIKKFIKDSIKNNKDIIIVIAGQLHIDAIKKTFNTASFLKKVGKVFDVKELSNNKDFSDKYHKKVLTIQDFPILTVSELNQLFAPQTTWEWFKSKASMLKSALIPAAVIGTGFAAWWLNKKNTPSAKPDTALKTKNPLFAPSKSHWWLGMTGK